ncbi:hypothetical protein [Brevundimonas sp. SORGH_AS_0993]|uniref:hypothetical protein n=1 Tax=Brevundimonas sp. SORGH_AS_0993 TaxID=3041794 RepID=UPI002788FC83|nr:hypothetical protein [Brevundimonas sp. SORGH_AS_0993]MDQ1152925.1 hypothetical protein [Brevundimonas sp. SORGH_AS_0993]
MRPNAFPSSALVAVLLAGGACAAGPTMTPAAAAMDATPQVTVTRDGEHVTVDYRFGRDATVWAFMDSALETDSRQPWRPRQWTVETPGVVMERRGFYDIVRSRDGGTVPREVRFRVQPQPVDLEAEYRTLVFSNGTVGLPTRQFDVFALPSVQAAEQLPDDLNRVRVDGGPARVTWRDVGGPVLFKGRRAADLTTTDERSYVLLGEATVTAGDGLSTVIDPNLPAWIVQEIRNFAPDVGHYYRSRLGESDAGGANPIVMAAWNGPTERVTSMSGSVLPGLIVMSFEGRGVTTPQAEIRERSRWFIAHEAAHFWLGQAVRYQFADEAWITEGGADMMAVRALKGLDPAYDDRAELQSEVDDCVALATKPVAQAGERGEHRAFYACGAVFALVAEGAQRQRTGGDWFDFLKPLLRQPDGVLSREEWLTALTRASRDPSLRGDVERLLDQGASDPSAVVARLFQRTGVAFRLQNGRVVLT